MQSHRPQPERFPAPREPMRADDVQRMLAARKAEAQAETRAPRRSLRRRLASLAIVAALYTLSIGPLYWKWYAAKVGLGSPVFLLLYRPLEKLSGWIPPFGHFLNWYVSLWIY